VRLVGQMEQALASLKEMFDALLNVSRLDAGLIEPNLRWVALADVVDRVAAGFKAEADQRGLAFRTRLLEASVHTDPAILEAILRNLLSNAMKFTTKGGVLVACRHRGGRVCLEVYDTGVGMDPGQQERIFVEFERAHRSATGRNDGLGLGLSLVQRYARLLDVAIEVGSRPGRGSRFRIVLPSNGVQSPPSVTVPEVVRPVAPLIGQHILVLDNEPLIISALSRDLVDRGNTVLAAETTAELETLLAASQSRCRDRRHQPQLRGDRARLRDAPRTAARAPAADAGADGGHRRGDAEGAGEIRQAVADQAGRPRCDCGGTCRNHRPTRPVGRGSSRHRRDGGGAAVTVDDIDGCKQSGAVCLARA
jgi:two-component sensor histidine kinase